MRSSPPSADQRGRTLVVGSLVDYAGVARAKTVPAARTDVFATSGIGASPTWVTFSADNTVVFTDDIGVAGDLRLRIDPDDLVDIGDGLAWAPADLCEQDGTASPLCPRRALRAVAAQANERGLETLMGTEIEFVVIDPDRGPSAGAEWAAYGMRSLTRHRAFLADLADALTDAGLAPEQLHAEFGHDQYEVSLPPAAPIRMADAAVLARTVIGLVAARHSLEVSFSPLPWVGAAANGAHLHLSLARDGHNIFHGGDGPHGLTPEGGAAIGGVLGGLRDLHGVYAGSVVSSQRLKAGSWSGASVGWGLENREAAVRLLAGTAGNPHGANIELKIVDATANIYLAAAALLGSALRGVVEGAPLPDELAADPQQSGAATLSQDAGEVLDELAASTFAEQLFGPMVVAGLVAVRRHEVEVFCDATAAEIAETLKMAWS
ncbi:glutamine synthetase family protein [Aeromicrobium endophyticum]|uniref:Glutamine synthetase n=1 Tax=Aeromicrobium endophyticum TaxID=2292704 RepID=A0A371P4T7_9ACTN|nr:glutamine synthetase family protein [Aeromicrobium endophyticum]REK70953.1 glutamine synthetase [Aeromicrobium endophyticum]